MEKKDLISLWKEESKNYATLSEIEALVERQESLTGIPVLPLYVVIKNISNEELALVLPKLSKDQRDALMDIDVWHKDEVDPKSVNNWLSVYSHCKDDSVVFEFIQSELFALLLKSRFNIWTFDVEEPEYPDHDNYFLTEDNQLLFEFDVSFNEIDDLKFLLGRLYSELGVEKAYAHLFKVVSDSVSNMTEEEYRFKKGRLSDLGFVDYFDSLQLISPFKKREMVDGFIQKKAYKTPHIDDYSKNQGLHLSVLAQYDDESEKMSKLLSFVEDNTRRDFLKFSFVRLNNAVFSLGDDLKRGSVSVSRSISEIKTILNLALDYLQCNGEKIRGSKLEDKDIFNIFDFIDLYKVGLSLIDISQFEIKTALAKNKFDGDHAHFLGRYFNDFIDNALSRPSRVTIALNEKPSDVETYAKLKMLELRSNLLISFLPFIKGFYVQYNDLKNTGKMSDHFYQNYTVDAIDFESILMTIFANFLNGALVTTSGKEKMGLTLAEYLKFTARVLKDNKLNAISFEKEILKFQKEFGLDVVKDFKMYLIEVLTEALEGYDFQALEPNDWSHVGGPILLKF